MKGYAPGEGVCRELPRMTARGIGPPNKTDNRF